MIQHISKHDHKSGCENGQKYLFYFFYKIFVPSKKKIQFSFMHCKVLEVNVSHIALGLFPNTSSPSTEKLIIV